MAGRPSHRGSQALPLTLWALLDTLWGPGCPHAIRRGVCQHRVKRKANGYRCPLLDSSPLLDFLRGLKHTASQGHPHSLPADVLVCLPLSLSALTPRPSLILLFQPLTKTLLPREWELKSPFPSNHRSFCPDHFSDLKLETTPFCLKCSDSSLLNAEYDMGDRQVVLGYPTHSVSSIWALNSKASLPWRPPQCFACVWAFHAPTHTPFYPGNF